MFAKIQRIHFVGIGGIGMSGIAEVLLNLGYKVSGSDLKSSAVTQRLASLGATTFEGHRAENIAGAEVVVTSSAIAAENPEVAEAHNLHIPVIQRAEMLAELMRLKYGIAIAGMHGKTTTTSMVAAVLAAGGLDPTVVVGGRVDAMGSNARLGKSQYLVAEADESDRSFLKLSPILSVVTNIDREHMDCYRNMRDVKKTFLDFMDRVPFYGMIVACNDDSLLRKLLPEVQRRTVTYGTKRGSDFLIKLEETKRESPGDSRPYSRFRVNYQKRELGEFTLHVPGVHNVLNATAAIAVGVGLDVSVDAIRSALDQFRGVDRRFQLKGRTAGVSVIDDYGHHPTEIRATLAAARQCGFQKDPRDLPASSLYAHSRPDGRIHQRLLRCRLVVRARHLCRQRAADRGHHRRSACSENPGEDGDHGALCKLSRGGDRCRSRGCARRGHDPNARRGQRLTVWADDSGEAEREREIRSVEVIPSFSRECPRPLYSWLLQK